jgi:hypothetical protein
MNRVAPVRLGWCAPCGTSSAPCMYGDRAVVQDRVAGGGATDDDGVGLLLSLRRIVRRAAEVQSKLSVEQPRIRAVSGDRHQTEIRTVAIHITTREKV